MKSIFTAKFGQFPLRFILKNDELFVSKTDLTAIFYDFFPVSHRTFVEELINNGIPNIIGDKHDITSGIVGQSEIGAVIHFHAVGNLVTSYSELTDAESEVLRNAAFQVRTFSHWYIKALSQADEHFGRTLEDLLMSVKNRLDRINPPYLVEVMYDVEDNVPSWIGTCDKLRLVTEGRTYEELQERVWEIAPEMHELQGYGKENDNIRISFIQTESHNEHQRLEM
ncbi:DUF1902 domain-containing protein [Rodentibacter ratti]|nr:DUF1902 domain-containing protein [Rodentibacter ratti]